MTTLKEEVPHLCIALLMQGPQAFCISRLNPICDGLPLSKRHNSCYFDSAKLIQTIKRDPKDYSV